MRLRVVTPVAAASLPNVRRGYASAWHGPKKMGCRPWFGLKVEIAALSCRHNPEGIRALIQPEDHDLTT
jgi:hypothetical protein